MSVPTLCCSAELTPELTFRVGRWSWSLHLTARQPGVPLGHPTHAQRPHSTVAFTQGGRVECVGCLYLEVHRLEQDFVEERRNLEQMTLQMGFELEQQRQEPLATGVMCWEQVQAAPSARRIVGTAVHRRLGLLAQSCAPKSSGQDLGSFRPSILKRAGLPISHLSE